MGLIEPIELPDPATLSPVHFIAIGGSGMNGIASAMVQLGLEVSGSDRQDSAYLRALETAGRDGATSGIAPSSSATLGPWSRRRRSGRTTRSWRWPASAG